MSHPSPAELSDFLQGKLSENQCDLVASHLEECPPCQATVHKLDIPSDTLLQALKRPAKPAPLDPACQQGMNSAMNLIQPTPPDAAPSVAGKQGETATNFRPLANPAPDVSVPQYAPAASAGATGGKAPTKDELIAQTIAARIFSGDDWQSLQPEVAAAADGGALLKRLVALNRLTKFQAQNIFQGRARGLVFGEYIVLDRIGAGGMGQVFKARHRRMDRLVALKVLASAAMKDAEAVKRFQREVKAAARLVHPHIVTAFDAGEAGKVHYLVMEFVDGHDLSGFVKKNGPLAVNEAVDAVLQAARGLAFAHAEGVVHRDIKPANLLRDKKGIVRVLDMGLARMDDPLGKGKDDGLTQSGAVMGTVDYMAPEQAFNSHAAGMPADVYSLGCTLYALLTGQPLYRGETMIEKVLAHREKAIPKLTSASGKVPASLVQLFEKMVTKQVADRPTMEQVVAAIEQLKGKLPAAKPLPQPTGTGPLNSITTSLVPVVAGSPQTAPSFRRCLPLTWLVGAAAACVLAACGIWVIVKNKQGEEVGRFKVPEGGELVIQGESKPLKVGEPPITNAKSSPTVPPATAIAPFDAKQARAFQDAWAKHLATEVDATNSIGMKLTLIPPGEFLMGTSDAEFERAAQIGIETQLGFKGTDVERTVEGPQHRVTISKPFRLAAHEVTYDQFSKFVEETGHKTTNEIENDKALATGENNPYLRGIWRVSGTADVEQLPVERVSWYDAIAFCNWLSKQEYFKGCYEWVNENWKSVPDGNGYRLPTEAEWEYSCRAGTTTHFSFGDNWRDMHLYGVANSRIGRKTAKVGSYRPNPWGLYDMHGNVLEWCSDKFDTKFYRATHLIDPVGFSGTRGPVYRVRRGGSYLTPEYQCRSAQRGGGAPDWGSTEKGFRPVLVSAAKVGSNWIVEKTISPATTITSTVSKSVVTDSASSLPINPTGPYLLEFDGQDYIDIPNFAYDGTMPLTVEMRLADGDQQRPSSNSWVPIFISESGVKSNHFATAVSLNASDIDLTLFNPVIHAFNDFSPDQPQVVYKSQKHAKSADLIDLGVVFNGSSAKIYVNGKAVNQTSTEYKKAGLYGNEVGTRIGSTLGSESSTKWRGYRGYIQQVRISKTARYNSSYTPAKFLEPDVDTYLLYKFDEGSGDIVKDSSGNNLHGKIVGAKWVKCDVVKSSTVAATNPPSTSPPTNTPAVTSATTLAKQYLLEFDGQDYIDIPNFAYDGTTPLTVEMRLAEWMPQKYPNFAQVFHSAFADDQHSNSTSIGLSAYSSELRKQLPEIHVHSGSQGPLKIFKVGSRIRKEELSDLAVVFDAGRTKLYVNGKGRNDGSWDFGTYGTISKQMQARIGAGGSSSGKANAPYTGYIQQVRISKTARYSRDYRPADNLETDADTYLLYKMDEGHGNVLNDSSGNNLHGQIVGAKWVTTEVLIPKVEPSQILAADVWHEVLPLVDVTRDGKRGTWERTGEGLLGANMDAGIMLPVRVPPGTDFEANVRFSYPQEVCQVGFVCPIGSKTQVNAVVASKIKQSGLSQIRSASLGEAGNDSAVTTPELKVGESHLLHIRVQNQGDTVAVTTTLNGKVLCQWTGPTSVLGLNPIYEFVPRRQLALNLSNSEAAVKFESISVRGIGSPLHLVYPPQVVAAPTANANSIPVDAIK